MSLLNGTLICLAEGQLRATPKGAKGKWMKTEMGDVHWKSGVRPFYGVYFFRFFFFLRRFQLKNFIVAWQVLINFWNICSIWNVCHRFICRSHYEPSKSDLNIVDVHLLLGLMTAFFEFSWSFSHSRYLRKMESESIARHQRRTILFVEQLRIVPIRAFFVYYSKPICLLVSFSLFYITDVGEDSALNLKPSLQTQLLFFFWKFVTKDRIVGWTRPLYLLKVQKSC